MRIECAYIDRVRTRNVNVLNWIEFGLSQSTSVCGFRMECWWAQFRHMMEVCTCILARGRLAHRLNSGKGLETGDCAILDSIAEC